MIRLLIFAGIAYFFYRKIKSWALENMSQDRKSFNKSEQAVNDIMIQDPYCKTYFPKREAVQLDINGTQLYFCSNQCREKFISEYYNNTQEDRK